MPGSRIRMPGCSPKDGGDPFPNISEIFTLKSKSRKNMFGILGIWGPVKSPKNYYLSEYNEVHELDFGTFASCEAQVAAISDDIAYNNHDLSDGLRAGLFKVDDLYGLPIVGDCLREVNNLYPKADKGRQCHEGLNRVFNLMVTDVLSESKRTLKGFSGLTSDIFACIGPWLHTDCRCRLA